MIKSTAALLVVVGAMLAAALLLVPPRRSGDRDESRGPVPVARSSERSTIRPPPPVPPPSTLRANSTDVARSAPTTRTAAVARAATSVVVVDGSTGAPISGALVTALANPIEVVSRDALRVRTAPDGTASLAGAGWHQFEAPSYVSECLDVPEFLTSTEVRLRRSGLAAIRVLDVAGRPLSGLAVRASTFRRLVDDDDFGAVARIPANAGQLTLATTDADGVATLGELRPGAAIVSVMSPDHAFPTRDAARISVGETSAVPTEIRLQPLVAGAAVIEGLPRGLALYRSMRLPDGWEEYGMPARDAPADCFAGQRERLRAALESVDDSAETLVVFVIATSAAPHGALEPALSAQLSIKLPPLEPAVVAVPLVRPSAWAPHLAPRVSVSDCLGALHPVELRFAASIPHEQRLAMPVTVSGEARTGAKLSIEVIDPLDGDTVTMALPLGRYSVSPRLFMPWRWRVPLAFEPTAFMVDGAGTEVGLSLTRPVAIITFDVRDEWGRPVRRYALQTKRAGMVFKSDANTVALDAESIEFAIGGVEDAGYRNVSKRVVALTRGTTNVIRVRLERKE
jgi:hypothetical protein